MALIGATTDEKIWNRLDKEGFSDSGKGGLMGNLDAESGLKSKNLQNTFEKKLGYTDESYTAAVDNGSYTNFVKDSAGYGLAQWTYWSRKQLLLEFAKAASKSIGDLEMQLDFLCKELKESYQSVYEALKTATSVREASDIVLTKFERPADQSEAVKVKRASYGQKYFDKFSGKETSQNGGKDMSNSSLVSYKKISPNKNSPRNHAIDTVTIHCYVGQVSVESAGAWFAKASAKCSCNYVIGTDGRIGLIVDEKDRSWCSSSSSNDNRAITIECASDTTSPYAVNSKVYASLINLLADICKRNNIKQLKWEGNKALVGQVSRQNMTVHRWFANKSCPGDYLYSRHSQIAAEVNKKLGVTSSTSSGNTSGGSTSGGNTVKNFPATPFNVQVLVSDLNYRSSASMNGTVKGQTGKGLFTITEVKDGWGKLKSGAGWIWLENPSYCTVKGTVASGGSSSGGAKTVKVTISDLNIRKGPGTNYGKTGKYTGKGVFTITEVKAGSGSTKGWGKLKSGAGWISLDYCE